MKHNIIEQTEHSLKAEFHISPQLLLGNQKKIIAFHQKKGKKLPSQILRKEVQRISIRQSVQPFKKEHSLSEWKAADYKILSQDPQKGIKFQADFHLLPAISLPDYKNLELEVPLVPVPTENDLMARLLDLQYFMAEFTPVERPIEKGDQVILDMVAATLDGETLPFTSQVNAEIWLQGDVISEAFLAGLIGMKTGENKEIITPLPQSYHLSDYRGQEARYRVSIRQVSQVNLPRLDEDFTKKAGEVASMDELMEQLYQEKLEENQEVWLTGIRQQVVAHTVQLTDPELSRSMVHSEMISHWKKQELPNLNALQLPEELIKKTKQAWLENTELYAESFLNLANTLVLSKIAEIEKLSLSSEELLLIIKPMADNFNTTVEELYLELEQSGDIKRIANQMSLEMAIDLLYDHAKLICNGEIIKDHPA